MEDNDVKYYNLESSPNTNRKTMAVSGVAEFVEERKNEPRKQMSKAQTQMQPSVTGLGRMTTVTKVNTNSVNQCTNCNVKFGFFKRKKT